MAGRPKQQVFVYTLRGKYIETFPSESSFRKAYYPDDIGKRPLFTWEQLQYKYHINLNREFISFKERPGRDKVKLIVAIHNSDYCDEKDNFEEPIQVYNLKGELIAEFKSYRLLGKLIPNKITAVHKHLNKRNKYTVTNPPGELFFKYKNQKQNEMV